MHARLYVALLLLLQLTAPLQTILAQDNPAPPRMGIRFGYGLDIPTKNIVGIQEYYLVNAGHRLGYGAFLDIVAGEGAQFSPYVGLEHVFWPKSGGYSQDCALDSFPTYWAVNDTLPGRSHRMYNVVVEPSFRFKLRPKGMFVRLFPAFSFALSSKVENYTHTCGAPAEKGWLDWEDDDLREMRRFNFGLGLGLIKEVLINERTGFGLETGFRFMAGPTFSTDNANPDGPDFNLYSRGFYLGLSFFR